MNLSVLNKQLMIMIIGYISERQTKTGLPVDDANRRQQQFKTKKQIVSTKISTNKTSYKSTRSGEEGH